MFKNKLVNIMIILLVSLTLIGVVTLVLINYLSKDEAASGEPTIDEIIAHSYDTPELTTMLLSNEFAKVQFKIHVDNRRALSEISKRDFQIENIIIRELAGMKSTELSGSEGITDLETQLKFKINELMTEGMVVDIYTRRLIIQ
ncbi:flagellar basal body-associated protein FliL [Alkalihalobacterium chitinilyticum]|uniref:Flagellar protein FliL n=1 Tax=Alkalihalobacterium chitinilyticum TaxID=2980103 RepID=A0ABT5VBX9_9BACI|nr:flagellar basal body-associated protein FliL [Alkalihalobacterium chitinilyticum]MDE5412958.1 flagellar basal body-associated protein FliL [Alkalihalobacterium chitinilyticum]